MHHYRITLRVDRRQMYGTIGDASSESDLTVDASSESLTEAFRELVARLPMVEKNALREALEGDTQ